MSKDKDDLFEEARLDSISKIIKDSGALKTNDAIVLSEKSKAEIIARSIETIEEGETQWDLLRRMIEGSLTEKFIEVISAMPDRDFARNYLKLLEHFKPKITRVEQQDAEVMDMTINIQTVIVNDKGEKELISIDEIKELGNE